MAKLPIDLKHFKKSHADDHYTTLKHKQGHEIKIAHKALSKEMKEKLTSLPMADGGEVIKKENYQEGAKKFEKGFNAGGAGPSEMWENIKKSATNAIASLAEGGPVEDQPQVAQQAPAPTPPVTINIAQPQIPQSLLNPNATAAPPPPQVIQPAAPVQAAPTEQPTNMQPQEQAPQQQVAQQSDPYGTEAYQNAFSQGAAEKKAGTLGEVGALEQQGVAQAKSLQEQAAAQQTALKDYGTHYRELDAERNNFQKDLNAQHIDPKRFLNSMGTAGRISTAIGLILGGIGGGLTHQENPALKFLNQQIDRDIESQKADLGKKENLLSANMRQFGNMRDALDMTRVMQNDIVINQLKKAAADAQSPMARASALKAIGDLDMQTAPVLSQIALRKTLMGAIGASQQDPGQMGQVIQAMRQLNPEMAKSMEERFIPGVGMAQVPVPSGVRENIIAKQTLAKQASDFYSWAEKHSGSVDPTIVNEGKTKAAELQSLYRNAINGGVFKKGEQDFIDQIVDSDPTKFFNSIRVLPKLNTVIQSNQSQLNTLKRGYGLPTAQIQESAPVSLSKK